jgi:hypothetical protein
MPVLKPLYDWERKEKGYYEKYTKMHGCAVVDGACGFGGRRQRW